MYNLKACSHQIHMAEFLGVVRVSSISSETCNIDVIIEPRSPFKV